MTGSPTVTVRIWVMLGENLEFRGVRERVLVSSSVAEWVLMVMVSPFTTFAIVKPVSMPF